MSSETDLVEHYGGDDLVSAIEAGLAATGKAPNEATIDDLGPVDEFHVGGRPATLALCEQLGLAGGAELSVLDIGCGIGGTARCLASNFDCRVTGIDLTPAYVEAARTLSGWTGLTGRVTFEAGSALAMPFPDDSFDVAVMLHVGMNIEDKAALFAEAARVLRPGGRFGVYDIVRQGPGDIRVPRAVGQHACPEFRCGSSELPLRVRGSRLHRDRTKPARLRGRVLRNDGIPCRLETEPAADRPAPGDRSGCSGEARQPASGGTGRHPRPDRVHRHTLGWKARAIVIVEDHHQPGEQ